MAYLHMNNSSIYIHVPWCRRRCPYCDFYLVVGKPHTGFIDALLVEWHARKALWHQGVSPTLYFGGGTPSLLRPQELGRLIDFFRREGVLAPDAEITLEANPEDISQAYAHEIVSAGINRISLGVQSFDDALLRRLGRKHSKKEAQEAIQSLIDAGLANLSVDLIIGVMGESVETVLDYVRYISHHNIPHISAYLLTIEAGTNFYKRIKQGVLSQPSEDAQADIYGLVQATLTANGYQQYDISSYAKPGFLSRHNQVYWGQGGFIGLGPGAHSMRLLPDGGLVRGHNQASLAVWLNAPDALNLIATDPLRADEALRESLAFGLRNMDKGIDPVALALRHQTNLPQGFFGAVEKLKNFGWLEGSQGVWRIRPQGALFADAIMREILGC